MKYRGVKNLCRVKNNIQTRPPVAAEFLIFQYHSPYSYLYFETRPQLINYFILLHLATMLLARHIPSPWSMELSTIMFTFSSNSLDDAIVPVIQDRSWQCHVCTYEQDLVPGSRTCIMCHSTRRWLHCAPRRVVKSKLVDRTRGSGKSLSSLA